MPGASLSGVVTEKGSGLPLPSIEVHVFDSAGAGVDIGFTSADGSYSAVGLPGNNVFARTSITDSQSRHVDELYDDILCVAGTCDPVSGTAIAVAAPGNTTGIDFDLIVGGAIGGTVTEDGSGDPLPAVGVRVFDGLGNLVGTAEAVGDGSYQVRGLPAGNYTAITSNAAPHVDELYNNILCLGGNCDPGIGTPIAVSPPGTTSGIDFALPPGGGISGSVRVDGAGTPLGGVQVEVFDLAGNPVATGNSANDGSYSVTGLATGTYFAATSGTQDHLDELYDNIACAQGACVLATGTTISIVAPTTTTGIDFDLFPSGAVTGTITEDGSAVPLVGTTVDVHNSGGIFVAQTQTNVTGEFLVGGLGAGTYFVSTRGSGVHVDEVYDDLGCEPSCDVTTGRAVVVTPPLDTTGIDFGLVRELSCVPDLNLTGPPVNTTKTFTACNTISAGGGFEVQAPGHVTLEAGSSVTLTDGFAVLSGARLTVVINPSL